MREGVGALFHQPEPGPDPSDVFGHRELLDGRQEVRGGLDSFLIKVKSNEFHLLLTKLELLFREQNPGPATEGELLADSLEVFTDGALSKPVPEDGVIHAALLILDLLDDLVVPAVVAVLGGEETLREHFIKIFSPGSQKSCQGLIIRVEGDTVVAILSIQACLPGVRRHGHSLVEG